MKSPKLLYFRCESFDSHGCEVGRNIYSGQSECERACHSESTTPRPEEPSCDTEPRPIFDCIPGERRTVYFYVPNRDTCLSLTDRGCLSGGNKYTSREVRPLKSPTHTGGSLRAFDMSCLEGTSESQLCTIHVLASAVVRRSPEMCYDFLTLASIPRRA